MQSARDPFVDATVKHTLIGEKPAGEADKKRYYSDQLEEALQSEVSRLYRISGVVYGEHGGSVLIGRHILHTGDTLPLPLGEKLLTELRELDRGHSLGWKDLFDQGAIPLAIHSITEGGIKLSNCLLNNFLSLSFTKGSQPLSPPPTQSTPK